MLAACFSLARRINGTNTHTCACVCTKERKKSRARGTRSGRIVLIFLPCEIARALHSFSTIDKATSASLRRSARFLPSPPPFSPSLARLQTLLLGRLLVSSSLLRNWTTRENSPSPRAPFHSPSRSPHLPPRFPPPPGPVSFTEAEAEPSDSGKNGSPSEIWGARTAGRYCFTLRELALHLPGGVTYEKHRNSPRGRKTFIKSLRNELERLLRDLTTYVRVYEVLPKEHRASENGESEDENVSSRGTLPSRDIIAGNLIPRFGGESNKRARHVLSRTADCDTNQK